MKLHELRPAKGATHKVKRIGRGDGSGHGGTSTKGTKGGQSRAGYKRKMAHEGGQMPIQRRVPKRGFNNIHRVEYKVLNVGQLDHLAEKYDMKEITVENLYINGLIGQNDRVKVLGYRRIERQNDFEGECCQRKGQVDH